MHMYQGRVTDTPVKNPFKSGRISRAGYLSRLTKTA